MEKRKSIVEPKCHWIVQFKREVEAKGSRIPHPIKYELVVPERMRLLNQSAYEPNANLYLGLNSYRAHEETSMHIYRLKARWAVFYFNQRTSQMGSGRSTELSSGSSSMQSGTDGEWGSFVHELQSVLQASMIQFDMLQGPIPEDELKDVLAADALFLFIYLLHMATPPEEAFRWLQEIPRESGHLLWNDIFLLENQIPLQILDRIAQDLFQNHRIFHEIQPRRLYNREIDLHAVLLGQPIQTASDFLLRELVFTAIKSSFKKVFLVHADFERDGYLRDIVENEVKVQRCDHLLDCLLQVICYRPLKAHGRKLASKRHWAIDRWKGVSKSLDFSRIQWGVDDVVGRFRYDIKPLTNSREEVERHLNFLKQGGLLTKEQLILSLRLDANESQYREDGELESESWNFGESLCRYRQLTYLLSPELILRLIAAVHGIGPQYVQQAVRGYEVYIGPEPPDDDDPKRRELQQILPHVRVILRTLGGTKWSRALELSSLIHDAPRWMRMRIIRCVMRFDPLHSLESNFWQAKTDLCMWMLGEAKYNAWSQGLYNIRLKVEQASFAYLSLFAYILSVCFVFVYAVWPPWLMVEIKKLLPPRKVIRAMYDEYQFRSRTLFKKRLVDALISAATPSAKIHGLILTYFAEKILLHEAHSRALEAKPPAEPVLLKVLTEAIEAHPDAIEFPVLNSSREVAADGETRIKKTWKNKMKSVSENMLEENWPIPSASRLKMAGLKICTCDMIHQTQLQLHQRVPVLGVPKVLIDDGTDSLLRNLAALERLKYPLSETPLACFIKLMDNLIDTPEDVLVLREAGVILHHLGSEKAVADMWNALGTGLPFYPSEQWATMLTQINVLTRDRHTLIWVEFKQKYMSKPWLVTGTVAAVLLLILAVSQTLFTAFQVFLRVPIH